jgi:hypothetical protein
MKATSDSLADIMTCFIIVCKVSMVPLLISSSHLLVR